MQAVTELVIRTPGVVGWRQMVRVTYVQHKTALFVLVTLFGMAAAAVLVTGSGPHTALASYLNAHCAQRPRALTSCVRAESTLSADSTTLTVLLITLRGVPLLIGMFLGAPLLAREFESGTFRFVWTQGVGRVRWLAAKLVLLGGGAMIGSLALSELVSWWVSPFNAAGFASRWQPGQFDLTRVTLTTWALLAFVLGVCLGAIGRRTLPAIALSAGVVMALLVSAFFWLDNWFLGLGAVQYRPGAGQVTSVVVGSLHRFASSARDAAGPAGSWLVRSWMTNADGHPLSASAAQSVLLRAAVATQSLANDKNATLPWLARHHYTYWVSYQPASRYWLFQSLEGGGLLLLALLIVGATVLTVRQPISMSFFRLTRLISRSSRGTECSDLSSPGLLISGS